jgi:hypothetical protein
VSLPGIGLFVAFIALAALAAYAAHLAAEKRRKELSAWGAERGLSFSPERVSGFDLEHPTFDCLSRGDNRYACNILQGDWSGRGLTAFDYHYETHSTDSKGHRQTHHHHFSAVILKSGIPLQHLQIRQEGLFDKIAGAFGFDDIDFESEAFSRKFLVKAKDRKWAYDVIHPLTMEFLMASPVFSILFDTSSAVAWRDHRLTPLEFEQAAAVVTGILERLPGYLVQQQTPPPLPVST